MYWPGFFDVFFASRGVGGVMTPLTRTTRSCSKCGQQFMCYTGGPDDKEAPLDCKPCRMTQSPLHQLFRGERVET